MTNTIFTGIYNAITNVFVWFNRIVNTIEIRPYIYGAIAVMLVVRFIIYPFLKEGIVSGSDGTRKKKDE